MVKNKRVRGIRLIPRRSGAQLQLATNQWGRLGFMAFCRGWNISGSS
jgi:hypothetical protein